MSNHEAENETESVLDPVSAEALAESLDRTEFGHLVFDALLRRRTTRRNPPAHHLQLTPHGRSHRPVLMGDQPPAVPLPNGDVASAEQQAQINGTLAGAAAAAASNGAAGPSNVQQPGHGQDQLQVLNDDADTGGAAGAVDGAAANVANIDLGAPPSSPHILPNDLQNERLMSTINGRLGPLSNTRRGRSPSFWGTNALLPLMGGSNSTSRVPD